MTEPKIKNGMNAKELRLAIEMAWLHTKKTNPGPELDSAKRLLAHLRECQAQMAAESVIYPEQPKHG